MKYIFLLSKFHNIYDVDVLNLILLVDNHTGQEFTHFYYAALHEIIFLYFVKEHNPWWANTKNAKYTLFQKVRNYETHGQDVGNENKNEKNVVVLITASTVLAALRRLVMCFPRPSDPNMMKITEFIN